VLTSYIFLSMLQFLVN